MNEFKIGDKIRVRNVPKIDERYRGQEGVIVEEDANGYNFSLDNFPLTSFYSDSNAIELYQEPVTEFRAKNPKLKNFL